MKRRLEAEAITPLNPAALLTLRRQCIRWGLDHTEALRHAPKPWMPAELDDRARDCWTPLLAIADRVGGMCWAKWARDAAVMLSGGPREDPTLSVTLLRALYTLFSNATRLRSTEICMKLRALPDEPWLAYKGGITGYTLADLLRPFDIKPTTLYLTGDQRAKGYYRKDFEDAWRRYVTDVTDWTPPFGYISAPAFEGVNGGTHASVHETGLVSVTPVTLEDLHQIPCPEE